MVFNGYNINRNGNIHRVGVLKRRYSGAKVYRKLKSKSV